jgi:hypothetical protein
MARKFALPPEISHLERMLRSLEGPLSPEGKRVLAAARAGIEMLTHRKEEVPQLHVARRKRALRSVSGGAPLREDMLPDRIREMLEQCRRAEE